MSLPKNIFDTINIPFGIWRRRVNNTVVMRDNHYHDSYEIYYLLEGERYYFIKNRTYHVMKGDLVFIKTYDIHQTMDADNPIHERILINFKEEFIMNMVKDFPDLDVFSCFHQDINVLRLNVSEQDTVETLLTRMLAENKKNPPGYQTSLKLLLCELLVFINRYIAQNPEHRFEYPNPLHKKVSDIVSYINTHYMDNVTLEHLSSLFYISSFYLSRVFKNVTGFTFVEYLNSIRIKEAQRLLRESGLKVTTVAERVGYESTTHFGRVFKASTGLSPLQYRKKFSL